MARGVNSPLSIQPDNLEVDFLLDTGCMIWYAENVQELFDMIIAGFAVAEQPDVHVPVITAVDGFFVSHTREAIYLPPDEFGNKDADIVFVACGTAASQAKEAVRMLEETEGIQAKVVKLKTIRPFPYEELLEATKNAKYIFIPEFNVVGWLEREVRKALYKKSNAEIIGTPRVAGGMTMPKEKRCNGSSGYEGTVRRTLSLCRVS